MGGCGGVGGGGLAWWGVRGWRKELEKGEEGGRVGVCWCCSGGWG